MPTQSTDDVQRQDECLHEAEPMRILLMTVAALAGIGG